MAQIFLIIKKVNFTKKQNETTVKEYLITIFSVNFCFEDVRKLMLTIITTIGSHDATNDSPLSQIKNKIEFLKFEIKSVATIQ